jgi:hypothetical protein
MGRLAKLNAAGLLKNKPQQFIVAVKHDYSYEVEKEEVAGVKIKEKVENFCYIPLGPSAVYVSAFASEAEADDFLKKMASTPKSAQQEASMFSQQFKILEVKYAPMKKGRLDVAWAKRYLIREIDVDIKKKKTSKLL